MELRLRIYLQIQDITREVGKCRDLDLIKVCEKPAFNKAIDQAKLMVIGFYEALDVHGLYMARSNDL